MLRRLLSALLIVSLLLVAGCETFKGFGRDLQKGGQAIEDAASK